MGKVAERMGKKSKTQFDIVHVNVDFSRTGCDIVASDHEPLLAGFQL